MPHACNSINDAGWTWAQNCLFPRLETTEDAVALWPGSHIRAAGALWLSWQVLPPSRPQFLLAPYTHFPRLRWLLFRTNLVAHPPLFWRSHRCQMQWGSSVKGVHVLCLKRQCWVPVPVLWLGKHHGGPERTMDLTFTNSASVYLLAGWPQAVHFTSLSLSFHHNLYLIHVLLGKFKWTLPM